MENATNGLIPTRQTLLSRLKDWDDRESWNEFFETYWKLIYSAATKSGLTDSEAQDVVQDTVIAVSKSLPNFKYNPEVGSFKSWLLHVTKWRIIDELRKRPQEKRAWRPPAENDTLRTDVIARLPDPNGFDLQKVWDEEWKQNLVDAAIERVKKKADSKQYQIFDLCVIKEWPISKITKTLRISAAQVYLHKHRISQLVKKELKALEARHNANVPPFKGKI
jgi:RNA polymerase sigma-70 factor (ECF subfamily)